MSVFTQIKKITDSFGPQAHAVDVTIDGVTESFHFKLLAHKVAMAAADVLVTKQDGGVTNASAAEYQRQIIAASLCEADGSPPKDEAGNLLSAETVGDWPATVVKNLAEAALKINSMHDKAKELIAKNSETTPVEGSSSI